MKPEAKGPVPAPTTAGQRPSRGASVARSVGESLESLARGLRDRRDALVETALAETGFPREDVDWEIDRALGVLEALGDRCADATLSARPRSEVAALLPYNGLVALPVTMAAAAVATGRCADLRFSKVFPRTGQFVGALLEERLPGARMARRSGREFLLRHLRRRDTRVLVVFGHDGWMLQYEDLVRRASPPKKLVFHGPSKNPFLVLEGADVAKAARDAVRGVLRHSGQACLAPARFYAVNPVAGEFVERVLEELAARSCNGDGSLVVARQSVIERLQQQLEDALAQGAQLRQGGRIVPRTDGPGARVEPAVLTGVSHAMAIMRDETFAPVLPIQEVADADEALAMAEDCRYALGASVYGEAPEIVRRLENGHALVCANAVPEDGYRFESGVGGYKASGWIWARTKAAFSRSEGAHRPWVDEFGRPGAEEEP